MARFFKGSTREILKMRKRIEVRSQAEFDICVAAGNIAVAIGCSVEAWGNSSVVARENSSVMAWGNVFVRLFRALSIRASIGVIIMRHDNAETKIEGDGTIIDRAKPTTPEEWCAYHGVEINDGIAVLYKGVNDDFRSDHGFYYAPGTIPIAPDWDGGIKECGGGLHYSPMPMMTKEFTKNATKFIACPVAIADMRAPDIDDYYPSKIKARGSFAPCWECDKNGKKVEELSDDETAP